MLPVGPAGSGCLRDGAFPTAAGRAGSPGSPHARLDGDTGADTLRYGGGAGHRDGPLPPGSDQVVSSPSVTWSDVSPSARGAHKGAERGLRSSAQDRRAAPPAPNRCGTAGVCRQILRHRSAKLQSLTLWLTHSLWSNTDFSCAPALLFPHVFPASLSSLR